MSHGRRWPSPRSAQGLAGGLTGIRLHGEVGGCCRAGAASPHRDPPRLSPAASLGSASVAITEEHGRKEIERDWLAIEGAHIVQCKYSLRLKINAILRFEICPTKIATLTHKDCNFD
jgi:hypothetical protein